MIKKCLRVTILLISLFIMSSCGDKEITNNIKEEEKMLNYEVSNEVTNYLKLEMVSGGEILIELDPKAAPLTVANMQKLVQDKFYNGLIFHRVISDFMIQTGDPLGNGTGGSAEKITGEFAQNGITNNLSHQRGVVSMARRGDDYNSASSQFFICQVNNLFLDGSYAAFGKVIGGMNVVDEMAKVATDGADKPLVEQKIKEITFIKLNNN